MKSVKEVVLDGLKFFREALLSDTVDANDSKHGLSRKGGYNLQTQINALNTRTSHVGMIIMSTTLDTQAKVIEKYGGTTWIQHVGYMLYGASSGVVANSALKTAGNTTVTLTAAQCAVPSHTHSLNNHTHTMAHTHTIGNHNHSMAHTHGYGHTHTFAHTHTIGNHNHSMAHTHGYTHTHGISHNHSLNNHTHTMAHTHSLNGHKHTLAHTHNLSNHTHTANHNHPMSQSSSPIYGWYDKTAKKGTDQNRIDANGGNNTSNPFMIGGTTQTRNVTTGYPSTNNSGAATATVTSGPTSGTTSTGGASTGSTGASSGNTGNASTNSTTGQNTTVTAQASATVTGGWSGSTNAASATVTAGQSNTTTGQASATVTGVWSGSTNAASTDSTGPSSGNTGAYSSSASAHDNMPPYKNVYIWERTA